MRHILIAVLIGLGMTVTVQAAVSKSKTQVSKSEITKELKQAKKAQKTSKKKLAKKSKNKKWNNACDDLLENSVKSTIALEKSLQKKKKKITRDQFDEKVHEELLVVQLNAWVCGISSAEIKKGASVEEQFLQDYSKRIQNRKL